MPTSEGSRLFPRSLRRAECLVRRGVVSAAAIAEAVTAELQSEPLAMIEYVTLSDVETLPEEVEQIRASAVLALAVRIGKTRLIDNKVLVR